jgi:hypothetical protein
MSLPSEHLMVESLLDSVLGEHWLRPPIIHIPPFHGQRLGVEAGEVFCEATFGFALGKVRFGLLGPNLVNWSKNKACTCIFNGVTFANRESGSGFAGTSRLMKTLIHSANYDDALVDEFGERADLNPAYDEIMDKFTAYATIPTSSTSILSLASEKLLVHSGSYQGHSRLFMISFTENEFSLTLQNFYSFSLSALKAS